MILSLSAPLQEQHSTLQFVVYEAGVLVASFALK
jgi:hypothetical protein